MRAFITGMILIIMMSGCVESKKDESKQIVSFAHTIYDCIEKGE